MSELHWLGVAELAPLIAEKKLSPVELLQALLARIAQLDPKINAFIRLDGGRAMVGARRAEQEIAAGRHRGPLHGIPIGIKDIIDVAGLSTTCHSKILLDNLAGIDAPVVSKLRAAGAIVVGKLSTHEFAFGGPSFDLPFPPARNPWNPAHHPGGSSSGSGAGLAAGFFPLALGTDTAGSIRNPASCCGIVGLKPTYGRVSRRGVFPLAFTLDHVGPMARTVADAALLLNAIAGHDPDDPGSAPLPMTDFGRDLAAGVSGLRVGFIRHFHETDMPADPQVGAALEAVAQTLTAEGAQVQTVSLPPLKEIAAVNRTIMHAEAWTIHAPWLRSQPGDYCHSSRRRLLTGAFLTAGDYIEAQRKRRKIIALTEDLFRDYDVLLAASSMDPPCRIDDADALARTYPRQARTPFNVTGHPALSMMAGLSADGLPLSVQFVGRYGDEATLLRVAAAYERTSGWSARHPALA
jgi:aspartyl-tRNA(Asn)/glutamyl-tRNA(Gln) amidotransferase subunit A